MKTTYLIFIISLLIVFYAYIGYGIVLRALISIKRFKLNVNKLDSTYTPRVALVVAAYNEELFIEQKIQNCLSLNYPRDLVEFIFITDGSTDRTNEIISKYPEIKVFHSNARKGKINAINRVYPMLDSEILIFSDANTDLNTDAIRNIVRHFKDEKIGVVSGEKRIYQNINSTSTKGEGIYWKYESYLKKLDSEFASTMGAAGELFAVRKEEMFKVEEDTLIEDFYLSMKIVEKGKRIAYEPEAYAMETGSLNIKEELKRKIRISAGGLQAIYRLKSLLNPFKHKWISFQYISHRVLRWALCPFLLPIILFLNIQLVIHDYNLLNFILLSLQVLFYLGTLAGYIGSKLNFKNKLFIICYYFFIMNFSVYLGLIRLIKGRQTVIWEKSIRA